MSTSHSLARAVQRKEFWDGLSEFLSTKSYIDSSLLLVGYGALAISELLRYYNDGTLLSPLSHVLRIVRLNPNFRQSKVLALAGALRRHLALDTVTAQKRFRLLSSLLSDICIFNRLWAIPDYVSWLWNEIDSISEANGIKEKSSKSLQYLVKFALSLNTTQMRSLSKIISLFIYQILENLAYLHSKDIIDATSLVPRQFVPEKVLASGDYKARSSFACDFLYIWSCRLWAYYVVAELYDLAKAYIKQYRETRQEISEKKESGDVSRWQCMKIAYKSMPYSWWSSGLNNLAYLPLTAHWSSYTGIANNLTVGVLVVIASWAKLEKPFGDLFRR